MNEDIFMVLIIFGTLFGIIYVVVSSRARVRLALIEKGADASIFVSNNGKRSNIFPIVLVNLALLLMSIGVGIFIAAILNQFFRVAEEVAYPGTIFLMAGIGLFVGYRLSMQIANEKS